MDIASHFPLLSQIDTPKDLRKLDVGDLPEVSKELRQFLIESVARTGGHFGSSLGTIELTVALHYVFNTPYDKLVWDVGHQTYGHKILTGRKSRMDTMRMADGLAPFPKREESEYDTFGVGHSSTSISAALGMAIAAQQEALQNPDAEARKAIAVIGDGALTAGLAYEALNHAGGLKTDMLVVLNDNDMSISPNVGAMNRYLARLLTGRIVSGAREGSKKVLSKTPPLFEFAKRTEAQVKGLVVPSSLFEELGFNYYGPVDGHDVEGLVAVMQNMKNLSGPLFLHVVTKKGYGYKFAEEDPLALHAVTPFDPATGKSLKQSGGSNRPTYTKVFGNWLCDMAERDPRIVGITPAMREGSGMVEFEQRFPDRYFDVGIAEQHAVTLAAGLACGGQKPIVAIYSTFLQRAYDQVIHDVAVQNLPVVFAIDRAGLVGPDGPTHAGAYDFSFLRCIPNMTIMAPADENECRQLLYTAACMDTPSSVRYPRGNGPGVDVDMEMVELAIGKAEVRREGAGTALLAFGSMVEVATQVGEALNMTVVNMRFVKPLDTDLLDELIKTHERFITIEENAIAGGAGAGIIEYIAREHCNFPVSIIGLTDDYIEHGSREELLTRAGLDLDGVKGQVLSLSAGT